MIGNLLLSRKENGKVHIVIEGQTVLVITVVEVQRGRVKLAFNGDTTIKIVRGELLEETTNEQ